MTCIIDYGVGNLFSLASSFARIGEETEVSGDPGVIGRADRLVLPGVGAFGDAAAALRSAGLDSLIIHLCEGGAGKPLLGICLGMQLLLTESLEFGVHRGLGLIPGRCVPIKPQLPEDIKVPHIGWNTVSFPRGEKKPEIFRSTPEGEYFYFVHSYHGVCAEDGLVAATTEYGGATLTAAVSRGRIYGVQFHPEKSGDAGLALLRAFTAVKQGE